MVVAVGPHVSGGRAGRNDGGRTAAVHAPHADLGGAARAGAVGARQRHAGNGLHNTALAAGLVARNHQRRHLHR